MARRRSGSEDVLSATESSLVMAILRGNADVGEQVVLHEESSEGRKVIKVSAPSRMPGEPSKVWGLVALISTPEASHYEVLHASDRRVIWRGGSLDDALVVIGGLVDGQMEDTETARATKPSVRKSKGTTRRPSK